MTEQKPTIYIGADHAGFELKEQLKVFLHDLGYEVVDKSPGPPDPLDDYPDHAAAVAREVAAGKGLGVLACKSGAGVCIAANKVHGIRAAVAFNTKSAELMKQEDDVNVVCISGSLLKPDYAQLILKTWLGAKFTGEEKRIRRLDKIRALEPEYNYH